MLNATVATDLLSLAEEHRVMLSDALEQGGQRDAHGQFFTPLNAARLIASMPAWNMPTIRLLDPGAGSGMLAAAVGDSAD